MASRVQSGSDSAPRPTPWYRVPMVWLVILIPFTAVVMGLVMLRLAIVSYDGLVVDDYYKHGKEINRVIERDRAAASRGLRGRLFLDRPNAALRAQIAADPDYTPPDRLGLRLLHATRSGFDQALVLTRAPDGSYMCDLPNLAAGRWHLLVEADDWRLVGSLQVPGDTAAAVLPGHTDAQASDRPPIR